MELSIIYFANWKLYGGNFRSIAHYATTTDTSLREHCRTQLWINATWTGRDMRNSETRRSESERDPVHVRATTRVPYAVGFMSTYLLPRCRASAVLSCRRERDCINAKRAGRKISTHGWSFVVNESLFIGIGTQVPATRPRACVRAWVRESVRAYVPERLVDGRKVDIFFKHICVVLNDFHGSRFGKYTNCC